MGPSKKNSLDQADCPILVEAGRNA